MISPAFCSSAPASAADDLAHGAAGHVGITAGLLAFDGAFDFMSLLGALSLIGLLIKNAIVLIEEIDQQIDGGKVRFEAVLDAAVSRHAPGHARRGHDDPRPDPAIVRTCSS
jgi:hypothetical protein